MIWVIIGVILSLLGYGVYKMFFSAEAKAKEAAEDKRRQEERDQRIAHYSSQPIIIRVANRISDDIKRSIVNVSRQSHIANITVTYKYSVFCDCITESNYVSDYSKGSSLVNFEYERIEDLSWSEQELVGIAIFRLVKNNINATYSKDLGGLDYSVKYRSAIHKARVGRGKYNAKTCEWEYNYDLGKKFEIIYSCQNGNYRDKTPL